MSAKYDLCNVDIFSQLGTENTDKQKVGLDIIFDEIKSTSLSVLGGDAIDNIFI